MRTLENIEAELRAARDAKAQILVRQSQEIQDATEQVRLAFKPQLEAADASLHILAQEAEDFLSKNSSHPLEGKRVTKQKLVWGRAWRGYEEHITLYGIVTVIRTPEDFPERKLNDRFSRRCSIGDVIVQRTNAKGKKLKSYEHIYDDVLPIGWKLVEEGVEKQID